MIDPILTALPLVQAGTLRALAVASTKRSSVPSRRCRRPAESGLAGLDFSSWYGFWGPRNLPPDIVGARQRPCCSEGMA